MVRFEQSLFWMRHDFLHRTADQPQTVTRLDPTGGIMSKRILIVDDEPRYLRLLEANLKTEGYAVVTAADGLQAIESFSAQPVYLVLLDVIMPRLGGFGAC